MKILAFNVLSTRLRSFVVAAVLAVSGLGPAVATVQASDYCPPSYRFEYVRCYEYRQVPYTVCVTRYDHCGCPYTVEVVQYRTVQVSVLKRTLVRAY
jgi:hypothetical protein